MTNTYQKFLDDLSQTLQKKAAEYPHKGNAHHQLIESIREFATFLIENTNFSSFSPNHSILHEIKRISTAPVFICGSMKSGTTLLTQLLDGHPQLFVLPGDTHYVNFLNRWQRDEFEAIACHWIQRLVIPTFKEPYWFLGPDRFELENFLHYLYYFLLNSEYDIPLCAIMAICAANTNGLKHKEVCYWVEKTPKNEFHLPEIITKFPNAKFIHILRDPLENIASLKKLTNFRDWDYHPVSFAYALRNSFKRARKNQAQLGKNNYLIVKYENLVATPQETMKRITDFLSIPYNNILQIPTENGCIASSNSMFADRRVKGQINNQSLDKRYKSILDEDEIKSIVTILFSEAVDHEYDWYQQEILNHKGNWLYEKSLPFIRIYDIGTKRINQRKNK